MPAETVFSIINAAVLPFWLLLLVAPFAKPTKLLVHSGLVPLIYGLVYGFYFVIGVLGESPEGAGMGSLQALMIAFTVPDALIAGWTHYLIFDLFVGAWIVRDAQRENIHHLVIVVPLIFTLMAGPLGLLLYLGIRAAMKQSFTLIESGQAETAAASDH